MNSFGEEEAWAYPGTAHFFRVPAIISGTGKATYFTFGPYIQRVLLKNPIFKDVVTYISKNSRRRQPSMSFDAPAQGNPREYPHEPYIFRN